MLFDIFYSKNLHEKLHTVKVLSVIAIFNPNKTYSYKKYMTIVIFQKYVRQTNIYDNAVTKLISSPAWCLIPFEKYFL